MSVSSPVSDVPGHQVFPAGATIHDLCEPIEAEYLLAEYGDDDWVTDERNSYTVSVEPPAVGEFIVFVRAAFKFGAAEECNYMGALPPNGMAGQMDQQDWPVKAFTVVVREPANEDCAVVPTLLDFGELQPDRHKELDFSVTNLGESVLEGAIELQCDNDHFSIFGGEGGYRLDPGEVWPVRVRYYPSEDGFHTCTVYTGGGCAEVECRGSRGDHLPLCRIDPNLLDFGPISVGEHEDQTVTIRNAGGGILDGEVQEFCGDFKIISGDGPLSLTAGASKEVIIRYEPGTAGEHSCEVDPGNALCINIECHGTAVEPSCLVEPGTLDFGAVTVGAHSDLSFVILNDEGPEVTGSISAPCIDFTIVSGGGPFSIAEGESHSVTARFAPAFGGERRCLIMTGTGRCGQVECTGTGVDPNPPPGEIHAVDPQGSGTYPNIQAAIDAAQSGDIVELASGTYRGDGNRDLVFSDKSLIFRSQSGNPGDCTIDCEGTADSNHRGFRVLDYGAMPTVFEGITITNGYIVGDENEDAGAAVAFMGYALELRNCIFTQNTASEHASAVVASAEERLLITGCEFTENSFPVALHASDRDVRIHGCVFRDNEGLGLFGWDMTVSESEFLENGCGGASVGDGAIEAGFYDSIFRGNGGCGWVEGGMSCYGLSTHIIGCTFASNRGWWGGGVYIQDGELDIGYCTFVGNRGDGNAVGINGSATVIMRNSIILASDLPVWCYGEGSIEMECCDVYDHYYGNWVECIAGQEGSRGNIERDPLIWSWEEGNYYLRPGSPCGDSGTCGLIGAWPVRE